MINEFITELIAAENFELIRIVGFDEILALPENLLSDATRIEVQEALQWSLDRQVAIAKALEVVSILSEHGYPMRPQQIAPLSAITELNERLDSMRIAVAEFEAAPTGSAQISDEIPVN